MRNVKQYSKQYLQQMVLKGLGKCPLCGSPPSARSPKGKLCERHVEMKANLKRKKLGVKKPFNPSNSWIKVDWTQGAWMVASLMGVSKITAQRHYKRLLLRGKIKAVPGFIQPVGGLRKQRRK